MSRKSLDFLARSSPQAQAWSFGARIDRIGAGARIGREPQERMISDGQNTYCNFETVPAVAAEQARIWLADGQSSPVQIAK